MFSRRRFLRVHGRPYLLNCDTACTDIAEVCLQVSRVHSVAVFYLSILFIMCLLYLGKYLYLSAQNIHV